MRFFQALSQQPMPYIPEQVPVLSTKETDMARSLFSSTAAPCLKCHATGDPAARQNRHRAQLPAGERTPEAGLGRALDTGSAGRSAPELPCLRVCSGGKMITGSSPVRLHLLSRDTTKTTASLLVDYIFQLTPEEQRRVAASMGHRQAAVQPRSRQKQAAVRSGAASIGGSR